MKQEDTGFVTPRRPAVELPRLRWTQILSISIFAFALNFHWAALGIIILPSQVLKIVGDLNKGTALAFVLVPGAFVSLFANPLFGWLSDRTHGRLAVWGRRRPYILAGTLLNVVALVWMASARDITSLMLAYVLAQFSSQEVWPVCEQAICTQLNQLFHGGHIIDRPIIDLHAQAMRFLDEAALLQIDAIAGKRDFQHVRVTAIQQKKA